MVTNPGAEVRYGQSVSLGAQTFFVQGAGNTRVSGAISGTGNVTKDGTGTLELDGFVPKTYTGATTVNGGTLILAKFGANTAIPGPLAIGDGLGGANADVVRLEFGLIGNSPAVTINSAGLLDLNGFTDTIGSLAGPGNVALGAGALTVGADSTSTVFGGAISGPGEVVRRGRGH